MPQVTSSPSIASSAQINPGVVQGSDIANDTILDANIGAHTSTKITIKSINSGLASARPATCAVGDMYISTDTAVINFCVVLNTWTQYPAIIRKGAGTQGDIIYHNGTDWVALGAGTSGYFLKTQGAGANPLWSSSTAMDIQMFKTPGAFTWTKPTAAKAVEVWCFGGGGGGGSGARHTQNNFPGGSAGGAGGNVVRKWFNATYLGATVAGVVGAGGAGGAAKSADGDGNAGTTGTDTTFGTNLLIAKGGGAGAGGLSGNSASRAGGTAQANTWGDLTVQGGAGGTNSNGSTIASGVDTATDISPRGGGTGGSNLGLGTQNGGNGGGFITNLVLAGGLGATTALGAGAAGATNDDGALFGGVGGGGGAGSNNDQAGNAGDGGAGGFPGGGGGGSGAKDSTAGGNSGTGGAGGTGCVVVISFI